MINHYKTLGVHLGTPTQEMRTAYLLLMRDLHPDRNGGVESPACAETNRAWAVLRDTAAHMAYRRELAMTCDACTACDGDGVAYRTGKGFTQYRTACGQCDGSGYVPRPTTKPRRKK